MDAGDSFDLALGGETLVKTFVAKSAELFAPGSKPLTPALDPSLLRLRLARSQIGADPQHGFDRDWLGDHVSGIAPGFAPDFRRCLEEIAHHRVVAHCAASVRALRFD